MSSCLNCKEHHDNCQCFENTELARSCCDTTLCGGCCKDAPVTPEEDAYLDKRFPS